MHGIAFPLIQIALAHGWHVYMDGRQWWWVQPHNLYIGLGVVKGQLLSLMASR